MRNSLMLAATPKFVSMDRAVPSFYILHSSFFLRPASQAEMLAHPLLVAESMASASTLRRDCLSTLESIAQSVGTVGPSATLGTVIPLLIAKSAGTSLILFGVVVIIYLFIAQTISIFATRTVSAGALSTYTRMGLGERAGVVVGWAYVMAMLFVVASSAVSCAYYFDLSLTHLSNQPSSPLRSIALTLIILAAAWWPARKDIRFSTKMMLAAELISVVVLLLILIFALIKSGVRWETSPLQLTSANFSEGRAGFVLAFMMLAGFESTTALSEETKGATQSIPRAMLSCLLPVSALYLLSIYALRLLSQKYNVSLDQSALPFDTLSQLIGAPSLGWLSSGGIALSCYTCIIAGLNAGSRVLYAMSQKGELPPFLARTNENTGNPIAAVNTLAGVAALICLGVLAFGVTLANGIDYLVQIASLGFLISYLGVSTAAPVYLARKNLLTPLKIVVTIAACLAIGCAAVVSVYPLASPPDGYLPFVFLALLGAGTAVSILFVNKAASSKAS